MRDPRRKKMRDLRRSARSAQRPHISNLFDIYHPEYAELDRAGFDDPDWRRKWHIYHDAQWDWESRIAGFIGGVRWNGTSSSYRRLANRTRRNRDKVAFMRSVEDGDWENYYRPCHRNTVKWDCW